MKADGDGFCQLCRWPHCLPSPQDYKGTHGQQASVTSVQTLASRTTKWAGRLSPFVSRISLIPAAGNFSKDRDPQGEASGLQTFALNVIFQAKCTNSCQNEGRFFSGCFPHWPSSEPCKPLLIDKDPWGGQQSHFSSRKRSRKAVAVTASPRSHFLHVKGHLELPPNAPVMAGAVRSIAWWQALCFCL